MKGGVENMNRKGTMVLLKANGLLDSKLITKNMTFFALSSFSLCKSRKREMKGKALNILTREKSFHTN